MSDSPRLAVRAILLRNDRVLLVNAFGDDRPFWCAPGGGVERHASLADNLIREVHEETGLTVTPGPLAAVSEFHRPGFHQVELYYRCTAEGAIDPGWRDPEGVVTRRAWFSQDQMAALDLAPGFLRDLPWQPGGFAHGPLLPMRS